ncbi:MAG: ABC transporter substrate-binding protein [Bacteroidales bacterium]|nr:ABC transporter substrate-binding protein [Bacteroidales bacterium]
MNESPHTIIRRRTWPGVWILMTGLWLGLLCTGCRMPQNGTGAGSPYDRDSIRSEIQYASGFTMVRHEGYTCLTVRDPWDTLHTLARYYLYRDKNLLPGHLPAGIPVQIPVTRTACLFGTDVCMLQTLDVAGTIVAVAEPEFISDSLIQEGIRLKQIASLGQAADMNLEPLLMSHPDILIVSPFEGSDYGAAEQTGIPLVQCVNYMENTPLGRAEWIKFLAAFYDLSDKADTLFHGIAERYLRISEAAAAATSRPTVFSEMKYGQTWSVPGGSSYMGRFFRDAGLDYLWRENRSTGSLMLSFETVYDKAGEGDFWVIKYHMDGDELTYSQLARDYLPYTYFKAYRERHIIVCNTARRPYYERGLLQPDIVLADLVKLVHPELLPGYEPVYFQMMEE